MFCDFNGQFIDTSDYNKGLIFFLLMKRLLKLLFIRLQSSTLKSDRDSDQQEQKLQQPHML